VGVVKKFIYYFLVFVLVQTVSANVISEVLYDPIGSELDGEFVEIYFIEDPSGFKLTSYDNDFYTIPTIYNFNQYTYVVIITGSGLNDLDASDNLITLYQGSLISIFGNSGDEVALLNPSNTAIDFIRYEGGNGDTLYGWPINDNGLITPEGNSIQLIGPDVNSSTNWIVANPTMGQANFLDSDNDFVNDNNDNCPNFNPLQLDVDQDLIGDACDNCIFDYNTDQLDSDQDNIGDVCDICMYDSTNDIDNDGTCEDIDNCPNLYNPNQADDNFDGIGNLCDPSSCESQEGLCIEPELFKPRIFLNPKTRLVLDDFNEPGVITNGGEILIERINNYAFEGEQIIWDVLVWDKNGKEKIEDVYVRLSREINNPDFIEVNCHEDQNLQSTYQNGLRELTGQIYEGEEQIEWNPETMQWYSCEFTVETTNSMHGEYFISGVATDLDGLWDEFSENEYWFFNPIISLGISGQIEFEKLRPGSVSTSSVLTIKNNAEENSGVLLDMFIAGTDFYDSTHSGAMCPESNVLRLTNFEYYASLGAYNTCDYPGASPICYVDIPYFVDGAGDIGNNNMQRIINGTPTSFGVYPAGNVLSPGSNMNINFKLHLPEPCNAEIFDQGQIFFYGEAI
jgi:hypothetical protein